jgi:hypothetical protein
MINKKTERAKSTNPLPLLARLIPFPVKLIRVLLATFHFRGRRFSYFCPLLATAAAGSRLFFRQDIQDLQDLSDMRLKTLEIKGFKSFANETVIHFNSDVTGVVGPNGSGKSNVVDAIRWVLGEQKSSQLRLDKMTSVIFNGTKKRKEGQMAQVSLTFENSKNILPTDYTKPSPSAACCTAAAKANTASMGFLAASKTLPRSSWTRASAPTPTPSSRSTWWKTCSATANRPAEKCSSKPPA